MARAVRIWPAVVALLVAVALEVAPLPAVLQPLRPPLPAMVLVYWTMMWPERFGLLTAFVVGLSLDILHGQLLGENAFALCVVTYMTLRFHLQIRIFPLWQLTMTVFALLTLNAFLQVLVEGVAGLGTLGLRQWPRVISGTLVWPVLMGMLDRVRVQNESSRGSY
ncbi:MAG: rod shape-determining protein MreD [Gammaproteobacteria bacterium]|jgi:rod shape-determining protein MreD|nr:rod shape-determining protein MreD [Gammaproteobacteria bacterium]